MIFKMQIKANIESVWNIYPWNPVSFFKNEVDVYMLIEKNLQMGEKSKVQNNVHIVSERFS